MLGLFFVTLAIISISLIILFFPQIIGVSFIANIVKFLAPDFYSAYQDISGGLINGVFEGLQNGLVEGLKVFASFFGG